MRTIVRLPEEPRNRAGRVMRRLALAALALLIWAGAAACSGGASKASPTSSDVATPSATTASLAAGGGLFNATPAGTTVALQTIAAAITVLPGGQIVTSSGEVVPPAEATQAAAAAGAAPQAAPTAVVPPTAVALATDAPLCVLDPSPGCSTPPPIATALVPAAQGIAIDTNPGTPDVDGGPVAAVTGQPFTVGVTIATAPQPYQGYEWDLVIAGPIALVSDEASKPANLTLCATTTHVGAADTNEYYGGCLSTDKSITYTGSVGTITLQCTGAGAGQLQLRKQNTGTAFGTDLLNNGSEPITGDVGPPVAVNCS